jgi:hypothetical protein
MPARRPLLLAALAAAAAPPAAGTIGIVTGGIDGTYARIAAVPDDSDALRILGRGSLQDISDILAARLPGWTCFRA